jgi:ribulose-5-phosphate 4-epimerase/fuculose-1-phosphate aldolase
MRRRQIETRPYRIVADAITVQGNTVLMRHKMNTRVETVPQPEGMSPAEWSARIDLACCYRLVQHFGMGLVIWNHISVRVPDTEGQFLLNPFGMMYNEITASNLVKVDHQGRTLDTAATINYTGFIIHGAIHAARPDSLCVLHTHSPAGGVVSALKNGFQPVTQDGFQFHRRVAYHDYEGLALQPAECARLVADLGQLNAMVLRNHGLLTCGRSVAEAFMLMFFLDRACREQVDLMSCGAPIHLPTDEIMERTATEISSFANERPEWPALMRLMDRIDPSYRT